MADGWGFRVQTVEYMPVGAGGYHWNVTDSTGRSLFVTADDLDTKDWLGDDRDAIAHGLNAAARHGEPTAPRRAPRLCRRTARRRRRPACGAARGPLRDLRVPVAGGQLAPLRPPRRSRSAREHPGHADRAAHGRPTGWHSTLSWPRARSAVPRRRARGSTCAFGPQHAGESESVLDPWRKKSMLCQVTLTTDRGNVVIVKPCASNPSRRYDAVGITRRSPQPRPAPRVAVQTKSR